ncbi:MAG: fibronectin type III domain-containing protein, partial [Bdellovibrionales bacterium]|nr:fibronectin type III domain-containing protein [Bdellovibrionales bacterium]
MKFVRQKLIGLSLIAITVFPACLNQQEGAQTGLIEPPPEVSGLSGTADSTTQITLNWTSGGETTDKFRASYQSGSSAPADCASGTTISEGTLGASTSVAVGSLSGSVWSFRVCSINANPTPDVSDGSTVTTYLLPANVTSLTAGSPSVTQISLSWTSGGGSTSGYRIAYQSGGSAPADCSAPQVSEGSITGTSHTIGSLTAGNQYSFRVCAINPNGDVASGTTVSGSVYLD